MSLNQSMLKFRALQEQAAKIGEAKQSLLQVYQATGTIYAAVDAVEAARLNGGISPEGFEAMRLGLDEAIKKIDAAIAVVSAQHRSVEKAAADTADDVNAAQLGMARAAGLQTKSGISNN